MGIPKALISFFAGTVLVLLGAELLLQFLPVNRGVAYARVDSANPTPRMLPHQSVQWSRGCELVQANNVVTNADGYTDRRDFRETPGTGIAIIGDSYVEALMAPPGTAIDEYIEQASGGRIAAFRMGISGAQAPTYAVLARHAVKALHAQAIVIVITEGDFAQAKIPAPGQYHYDSGGTSLLTPYHPSALRQLLKQSALLSYFRFNCKPDFGAGGNIHMAGQKPATQNKSITVDHSAIRENVSHFLRDLKAIGLPPGRIIFLVDGDRRQIYSPGASSSANTSERELFMAAARAAGHEVVDLMESFRLDHDQQGRWFDYPTDRHWNATGHRVAATALLRSAVLEGLLNGGPLGFE